VPFPHSFDPTEPGGLAKIIKRTPFSPANPSPPTRASFSSDLLVRMLNRLGFSPACSVLIGSGKVTKIGALRSPPGCVHSLLADFSSGFFHVGFSSLYPPVVGLEKEFFFSLPEHAFSPPMFVFSFTGSALVFPPPNPRIQRTRVLRLGFPHTHFVAPCFGRPLLF